MENIEIGKNAASSMVSLLMSMLEWSFPNESFSLSRDEFWEFLKKDHRVRGDSKRIGYGMTSHRAIDLLTELMQSQENHESGVEN